MSTSDIIKLIPRNAAALRRSQTAASAIATASGNPVSTRLESGVGNCFPGLECDLRNLERRFFPFLEVNITNNEIAIVSVDTAGVDLAVNANTMTAALAKLYRALAQDIRQNRRSIVSSIKGNFGPFGSHTLAISDLAPPTNGAISSLPPDAWTAIRLLPENSAVTLVLQTENAASRTFKGARAAYLSGSGSLAAMFEPGELTQSLCSPWTHDFRDCGCFYWASNHPDIVQPPTPDINEPDLPWLALVPWERQDRNMGSAPPAPASSADSTPIEIGHYAINHQWQSLNFVLEGRETIRPYKAGQFSANPLASMAELQQHLRYAAGVELAAIQEYLSAAFSLLDPATVNSGALRDNITVSLAELMRISYGEMRHLRAVNDVLQALNGAAYTPAMQVAKTVPAANGGMRPVRARVLDPQALSDFLTLEQANLGADELYARILVTLQQPGMGSDADCQTIRSIMAEGQDHFETFENIQEWLKPFQPAQYLHQNLKAANANNSAYQTLQKQYRNLLDSLYTGYLAGFPKGAHAINGARTSMVSISGFGSAAKAVISAGFLLSFDAINDPRFQAIDAPATL